MNTKVIFKKLANTSPAELLFRGRKLIGDHFDRRNFRKESSRIHDPTFVFLGKNPEIPGAGNENAPGVNALWTRNFFLDGWDRQEIAAFFRAQFQEEFRTSMERADVLMNNRLRFLGFEAEYPEGIDWHCDPLSAYRHPLVYHKNIMIFDGNRGQGDIKHIWEVNRHQFFIDLGKAYYLTGDEKYAKQVVALFLDWYEKNPYKYGVNWTSALEVAVRALAWIWAFALIKDSGHFTQRVAFTLQRALFTHARYLSQNLSFYFSPFNHLIGETTALFVVSYLFPNFKGAKRQSARAWKILVEQVEKQFHSDGMTVEQASYYHHFTLGFYFTAVLLKQLNGELVPAGMLNRLEKATEIAMYMTRPDGTIPRIGDVDDGLAIYFSDPASWDFRSFLNMGALLFKRPDMKFTGGTFQENAFWLFGKNGYTTFQKMPAMPRARETKFFPESGYLITRSGWKADDDFCLIDAGPLAAGVRHDNIASAAHGHMDFSSFEFHRNGKPLIVDGGFYTYNGPWEWSRYFRLTSAHNTITVDGESQAVNQKSMKMTFAPHHKVLNFHQDDVITTLSLWHDGFHRLPDPVLHTRTFIQVLPDLWLMRDKIEGSASHQVALNYHLHQEIENIRIDDQCVHIGQGEYATCLNLLSPTAEISAVRGGEEPFDGWLGENYGIKHPAYFIQIKHTAQLPCGLLTALYPDRDQENFKFLEINSDIIKSFRFTGAEEDVLIILNEKGRLWKQNGLESDAELVVAVTKIDTRETHFYLWNVKRFVGNETLIVDAAEREYFFSSTINSTEY